MLHLVVVFCSVSVGVLCLCVKAEPKSRFFWLLSVSDRKKLKKILDLENIQLTEKEQYLKADIQAHGDSQQCQFESCLEGEQN